MEPLEKLKQITAWDVAPTLSVGDLGELLINAALIDLNGLAPVNEQWTPTYDFNAAAANGWLVKAGRASTTVEIDPPGSGIITSKVFDNCRRMARTYSARRGVSLSLR